MAYKMVTHLLAGHMLRGHIINRIWLQENYKVKASFEFDLLLSFSRDICYHMTLFPNNDLSHTIKKGFVMANR